MKTTEKTATTAQEKKAYHRPKLIIFGSVSDLTRHNELGSKNDHGAPGPHKAS